MAIRRRRTFGPTTTTAATSSPPPTTIASQISFLPSSALLTEALTAFASSLASSFTSSSYSTATVASATAAAPVSPSSPSSYLLIACLSQLLFVQAADADESYSASSSSSSSSTTSTSHSSANSSNYQSSSSSKNKNSNSNKQKGALQVHSFCQQKEVQVLDMTLTCDSPGAYYYGSSTYRNSVVCMSNDKARLQLTVALHDNLSTSSINVSISSGIYDHWVEVTSNVDFCQLGLTGDSVYTPCPRRATTYTLRTYFSVPQIRDYSFHYTPDIKILFTNEKGKRLGCATSGTVALHKQADNRARDGLIALGVSVLLFVIVFAVLIYLSYRRKKRIEKQREVRRYNFFRTTATGRVVPLAAKSSVSAAAVAAAVAAGNANNTAGGPQSPSTMSSSSQFQQQQQIMMQQHHHEHQLHHPLHVVDGGISSNHHAAVPAPLHIGAGQHIGDASDDDTASYAAAGMNGAMALHAHHHHQYRLQHATDDDQHHHHPLRMLGPASSSVSTDDASSCEHDNHLGGGRGGRRHFPLGGIAGGRAGPAMISNPSYNNPTIPRPII